MPASAAHTPDATTAQHLCPPLHLAVPATAERVAGVRAAVRQLGADLGLAQESLADVVLAVGEVCANAVVHAYAGRDAGLLEVHARAAGDALHVRVVDHGHGLAARPDSPGLGLGLPLAAALSDELELRGVPGGGTEVAMAFGLPALAGSSR